MALNLLSRTILNRNKESSAVRLIGLTQRLILLTDIKVHDEAVSECKIILLVHLALLKTEC